MKLQALRPHYLDGKVQAVGTVYDVAEDLARQLIAAGKARVHVEAAAAASPAPAVPDKPARKPKAKPMTVASLPALVPGADRSLEEKDQDHD